MDIKTPKVFTYSWNDQNKWYEVIDYCDDTIEVVTLKEIKKQGKKILKNHLSGKDVNYDDDYVVVYEKIILQDLKNSLLWKRRKKLKK